MGQARGDGEARSLEHAVRKRSVAIAGHRTSVSLEEPFWAALREIAAERGVSLAALLTEIDRSRRGSLSSAARLYVLERLKERLATTRPVVRSR